MKMNRERSERFNFSIYEWPNELHRERSERFNFSIYEWPNELPTYWFLLIALLRGVIEGKCQF